MTTEADLARQRAEARVEKARELAERRAQVQAEDEAAHQHELANTARLRALRLARDEALRVEAAAAAAAAVKAPSGKRKAAVKKPAA